MWKMVSKIGTKKLICQKKTSKHAMFFLFSFASQSILNTHIRGVHEGAYMHVCEVCAKVFKSKMFFEKHKMDVHMNIQVPKIQCQLCGSWLKHERSLRSHMERHEAEKNTYVCKICGKVAPNKEALQSHNRYVHLTERTHKCSVCAKAFKKAINLKVVCFFF
jgi:hypothetical protein